MNDIYARLGDVDEDEMNKLMEGSRHDSGHAYHA